MVFSAAVVMCLAAGVGVSCAAPHMPSHVVVLEKCGGTLMVAGLALLGAALQSWTGQFPG